MNTNQNNTRPANRAAATRAANKAHAARLATIEAAITATEQAVAGLIATHEALVAAGIATDQLSDAIHAGWDAISELHASHNAAERAHSTRGIDSNTLALVAANID